MAVAANGNKAAPHEFFIQRGLRAFSEDTGRFGPDPEAAFRVNLARMLNQLKEAGFSTYGRAESGDTRIGKLDLKGRTEKCGRLMTTLTSDVLPSLDTSNAATVAAYDWWCRRPKLCGRAEFSCLIVEGKARLEVRPNRFKANRASPEISNSIEPRLLLVITI